MPLPEQIRSMPPPHLLQEPFVVRAGACDNNMVLSLPGLCGMLQEVAMLHAYELGIGVEAMRLQGLTWMLARMRLNITHYPPWNTRLAATTWPSGLRGRLSAVRDFIVETESGEPVATATSEWLMVDLFTGRVVQIPEDIQQLAPPGTVYLELPTLPDTQVPEPLSDATFTCGVRRADLDMNNHVNHVRYLEWMLDTVPEEMLRTCEISACAIRYQSAAALNETICVQTQIAGPEALAHQVLRAEDDVVLATAHTFWRPRA